MQYKSEGRSYLEIIQDFYISFREANNTVTAENKDALKAYLMKQLSVSKEVDAQFLLEEKTKQYYRRLNAEIKGQGRVVKGRPEINVVNIFDTGKSTYPSRLTLFEIAFALGLDEKECNEMFRAAGQYEIHLGGDPQESILYFCLKKGLTHLDAIRMHERYCRNSSLSEAPEELQKTMSQRSRFVADALLEAIAIEDFDTSKQEFEAKLPLYAASYSYFSGRVRRYVLRLLDENTKKDKGKTSVEGTGYSALSSDFCVLFDRDRRGVSSELDKVRKAESHPTREFVCMLLCLDYYRNYQRNCMFYSLEEYINNELNDFGMEELNDARIIEALLIELSKFQFHDRKSNMVRYDSKYWIILPKNDLSYIKQAGYILNEYIVNLEEKHNMYVRICNISLIHKNAFLQDLFLKTPGDSK